MNKTQTSLKASLLARLIASVRLSESTSLLLLAIAVGLATGVGVWIFRMGIDFFQQLVQEQLTHEFLGRWLGAAAIAFTLPVAGLLVGWIMERFVGHEELHGVAAIIQSVALAGGRMGYWLTPIKALMSAFSLGVGAAFGPEDPSVLIGASWGSFVGNRLRLSEERVRLLVSAGAASGIAAAFKAPIAGVFFALEVILNGEFTINSFGVVVLAAVISSAFTQAVETGVPELGIHNYAFGGALEIPLYVILGVILAPVAVGFIRLVYWQQDVWHHLRLPPPLKTALAGLLIGVVAIFVPQILGPGREVMSRVLSGESQFTLLALFVIGVAKWALTPVSVAGGFPGGNFAPVLFVGTMLGGAFGDLIQSTFFQTISSNAQSFAIAGMAAMLAGVMRAPITAIMLVFEITNDYRLILPIMLASVVCVLISERLMPEGMGLYTFGLMRLGIRLQQGRDIDVMQGIMVREAMTTPAPTIPESATLDTLRDAFRQHQTRSLCVVDLRGELVGIVTLSDLQRAYDQISQQKGSSILTVGDICTRDVVTASPDDVLWTAIRLMGARDIGRLPVIKPNTRELLGILRRHNIVTAYALAITRKQRTQQHQEIIRLKALTGAHVFEMHLEPGSPVVGKRISEVKWPLESIVASIQRRNKLIVPHGNTVLQAGDILTIVADERAEEELVAALGI